MSIIANNLLQGDEGYNIARSLRFRASASAYLSRTPASSSNRKTWSFSAWVKRGSLGALQNTIFSAGPWTNPNQLTAFAFATDNTLTIASGFYGVSTDYTLNTAPVFRDPSAWYHLVLVYDTTQATASNRVKLYCNGVQQTLTGSYPVLNYDTAINSTLIQKVGMGAGSELFDGYMTEVNFIDGQALTPSSFGETDVLTGVWKPKKYAGTYGTNGFYLPFSDNTSTTTLGYDKSGNSNNWTCNNISLTTGSTYDSMVDVPTMSALASNYCVMNPLRPSSYGAATLSDGNLKVSQSAGAYVSSTSTMPMSSGKWYWEVNCGTAGFVTSIGIASTISANGAGASGTWCYHYDGTKYSNGSNSAYGASYTGGDVLGFAFDASAGSLTCYKNGVSQGVLVSGLSAGDYYAFVTLYNSNNVSYNFGQRPFSYTPPTGFVALNTFNLPEPTIKAGNKHFDATTYTGNNTTNVITNSGSMQPDLVWIKSRSTAANHALMDVIRGVSWQLQSSTTNAESQNSAGKGLQSFNSNGFTLGQESDAVGGTNANGASYVGWQWKANGTGSSNTAGSITSQVSANPSAGFSVVTYTGNGTQPATVGHGLGVAPKMVIVKDRSDGGTYRDWAVYNSNIGAGNAMLLNSTSGSFSKPSYWNSTPATSSVFTLGSDITVNQSGSNYVAYCFSEVAGFSKFGSYTGNGSADGTFVHLGFRPKFVIVKSSSVAGTGWYTFDTSRTPSNVMGQYLEPQSSGAEGTFNCMDFLSNGFKFREGANAGFNQSGQSYIYMAFAESPFRYSLAR